MIREVDIVQELRELIEGLKLKVCVKSSIDNEDGTFTIETCNTQYLSGTTIYVNVNGSDYIVKSVENNKSVTLSGSPMITEDFNLDYPLFIPDTPQGTNTELIERNSDLGRHPFIWLLENFPINFSLGSSPNIATTRMRFFFLDTSQDEDWTEDLIRKNCIIPMMNLCDAFLRELEVKLTGKIENFTIYHRIRFGNNQGKKKILDENLSGVELDINLEIKKWAIKCTEC